jgi:hypothetical protein
MTKPFIVASPSEYVTGSSRTAAFALVVTTLVTVAMAQSAPAIFIRMADLPEFGTMILACHGFPRQTVKHLRHVAIRFGLTQSGISVVGIYDIITDGPAFCPV